jgi:hypothetical protein
VGSREFMLVSDVRPPRIIVLEETRAICNVQAALMHQDHNLRARYTERREQQPYRDPDHGATEQVSSKAPEGIMAREFSLKASMRGDVRSNVL